MGKIWTLKIQPVMQSDKTASSAYLSQTTTKIFSSCSQTKYARDLGYIMIGENIWKWNSNPFSQRIFTHILDDRYNMWLPIADQVKIKLYKSWYSFILFYSGDEKSG